MNPKAGNLRQYLRRSHNRCFLKLLHPWELQSLVSHLSQVGPAEILKAMANLMAVAMAEEMMVNPKVMTESSLKDLSHK